MKYIKCQADNPDTPRFYVLAEVKETRNQVVSLKRLGSALESGHLFVLIQGLTPLIGDEHPFLSLNVKGENS